MTFNTGCTISMVIRYGALILGFSLYETQGGFGRILADHREQAVCGDWEMDGNDKAESWLHMTRMMKWRSLANRAQKGYLKADNRYRSPSLTAQSHSLHHSQSPLLSSIVFLPAIPLAMENLL